MEITIPVGLGELLDKLSILEIKSEKISDPSKLINVRNELNVLLEIAKKCSTDNELYIALKEVNIRLWDIEDKIRIKESLSEFDDEFIELARNVYKFNDRRAEIKRKLNMLYNSNIIEEKSYKYRQPS